MKNKFVIIFYTKPDGTDLIKAFLDDLPVKLRVKAYGALALQNMNRYRHRKKERSL